LRDGTCWCGGNNHVQHASTARLRRIASKLGSSYPEDGDKVAQPGDIAPLEQCTGEVSRDQFVPVSPAIAWLALAKIKSARRFL
jgi:hypothetical protein